MKKALLSLTIGLGLLTSMPAEAAYGPAGCGLGAQFVDKDGDATGRVYGTVGLAAPDSSSFTAYADITKADAIAWAKAALGDDAVAAAEAAVAAQIAEQKNPTAATGVPW